MPIRLNTNKDELAHLNRLNKYAASVNRIYDQAVKEFLRMSSGLKLDPTKPFSFDNFPQTKDRVSKLINKIVGEVTTTTKGGMFQEWDEANKRNDRLVDRLFTTTSNKKGEKFRRYKQHNLEAFSEFQNRKVDGLGLSDRIWNNTKQFKSELEMAIGVGLSDGRSAAALARDVKKYLNDPDKIFRRVKDSKDKLRLSEHAKQFHPGQGKYRSSRKNAERLTRTEINMSYRMSDHTRWQQMDFIVGFEVKLSNRNTHSPVCEALAGKYPKDFKFGGWHPHCMCYVTSIMMTDAELDRMEDAILNAEPIDFVSENAVTDLPGNFK